MECKNYANCSFVGCCQAANKATSVEGFVNMYCKGSRMSDCVRLKISSKYGKENVPKNMMPNGYPMPGTTKDGWSDIAKNFSSYI